MGAMPFAGSTISKEDTVKKQYFMLVMASALLAVMTACAPMQPNPDTVQNGEGPATETSLSSEGTPPQEKENGSQPLSSVVCRPLLHRKPPLFYEQSIAVGSSVTR